MSTDFAVPKKSVVIEYFSEEDFGTQMMEQISKFADSIQLKMDKGLFNKSLIKIEYKNQEYSVWLTKSEMQSLKIGSIELNVMLNNVVNLVHEGECKSRIESNFRFPTFDSPCHVDKMMKLGRNLL